jgi:heat shock 70kDa protein 4
VLLNNPGITSIDAVITVPPWFSDAQRRAVKDAASIGGLNALRILNDGTAASVS